MVEMSHAREFKEQGFTIARDFFKPEEIAWVIAESENASGPSDRPQRPAPAIGAETLRRIACSVLMAALVIGPALAVPGQTGAQLEASANSSGAFTKFIRFHTDHPDPDSADYEYIGTLTVDGHETEFHAKPSRDGTIEVEFFVFSDLMAMTPSPAPNIELISDTLARVYGAQYASDFKSAQQLPSKPNATMWRGKLLGYFAFGGGLVVFTRPYFDAWAAQMH